MPAGLMIRGSRVGGRIRGASVAVLIVLGSWSLGRAIAGGGLLLKGLLGVAVLIVVGLAAHCALARRVEAGFLTVEVPILLVLSSTLVLRLRTNDQLADNPLDSAALLRVLCMLAAGGLAAGALLSSGPPGSNRRRPITTLPTRLYGLYAFAALLGAPFSLFPLQTLYRVTELFVMLLVMAAAYWVGGEGATRRVEATLYWFLTGTVIVIWLGLAVSPGRALEKPLTGTGFGDVNLIGLFPAWAANQVGAHGMLLAVWSFARLVAPLRSGARNRSALPLFILGTVTLVLAQYRTGYGAFVVGMALILGVRRREVLVAGAVGMVAVLALAPGLVTKAQPYALRGESRAEATKLSGRVEWWSSAVAAWRESPIVGRGLRTASRYEVLTTKGTTKAAGIHSTWLEVLLGTGLLGLSFFIPTVLVALSRARRLARSGPILPLVILGVTLVRTFTANTFDSSSVELVVFLAVVSSLTDPSSSPSAPPAFEEQPPSALAGEGRRRSLERRTQERTNCREGDIW